MGQEILVEKLKALANGNRRSETARLRDVLDEVESALNAGVTRGAVLDVLHEQGFRMTMRSFEAALYRIRKAKKNCVPQGQQKIVKIAGFNVSSPARIMHNAKLENDLLK